MTIKNITKQIKSVSLENKFAPSFRIIEFPESSMGEVTVKFNGFDIKIKPEQINICSILKHAADCISKEKRTA